MLDRVCQWSSDSSLTCSGMVIGSRQLGALLVLPKRLLGCPCVAHWLLRTRHLERHCHLVILSYPFCLGACMHAWAY